MLLNVTCGRIEKVEKRIILNSFSNCPSGSPALVFLFLLHNSDCHILARVPSNRTSIYKTKYNYSQGMKPINEYKDRV